MQEWSTTRRSKQPHPHDHQTRATEDTLRHPPSACHYFLLTTTVVLSFPQIRPLAIMKPGLHSAARRPPKPHDHRAQRPAAAATAPAIMQSGLRCTARRPPKPHDHPDQWCAAITTAAIMQFGLPCPACCRPKPHDHPGQWRAAVTTAAIMLFGLRCAARRAPKPHDHRRRPERTNRRVSLPIARLSMGSAAVTAVPRIGETPAAGGLPRIPGGDHA